MSAAKLRGRWIYGRFGYARVLSARLEDRTAFLVAATSPGGPVPIPAVFSSAAPVETADSEREARSRARSSGWDGGTYLSHRPGACR